MNSDRCGCSKFTEVSDDFVTTIAVCRMPRLNSSGLNVSGSMSHCAIVDGGRVAKHSISRE